jgi:hypothetical protein
MGSLRAYVWSLPRRGPQPRCAGDRREHTPNISEAIRKEALAVLDGFAQFIEVRYCGLSSGTFALAQMVQQADAVADRLMELLAEMHRIAEG